MKKIKLTPKAEDDLTAIWNYSYSNFGEAKADEYVSRLGDIFEVIATHKIGIARPELEASIFSLPIEHHIIFSFLPIQPSPLSVFSISYKMPFRIYTGDNTLLLTLI